MDPEKGRKNLKKVSIKILVTLGMFSAIAYVLMLLKFPILPAFPFLKLDFSEIPALIAVLVYGPGAGIIVEFLKNVLDYLMTGSETGVPVGHISNFIAGLIYILPVYYIYQKLQSKKGMMMALLFGTVFMSLVMCVLNYFIFIPAYTWFLGMPEMSASALREMIVLGVLPFNLIKGILTSVLFMVLFAKLHSWLGKLSPVKNAA